MKNLFFICLFSFSTAFSQLPPDLAQRFNKTVKTGADQMEVYLPLLNGKRVAIVGNQTSQVNGKHLVDTLLSRGVKIKKVFSPEHGFRGTADAGEHLKNYQDHVTGLPIISLYGKHYKPKPAELKDVDLVLFDIQDVGVRFYTYISSLHYVMEACAEAHIPVMVLDRPNPNGFYIDGPVREDSCQSFVGMHPVPVVYGCTIGEYAKMINGEKWLKNGISCTLTVVPLKDWTHKDFYDLPVKPSPNLSSAEAIWLYPSLCLFEGTLISVGRGTPDPFTVFGHPRLPKNNYSFVPVSMPGASKTPPYMNDTCYGRNMKNEVYEMVRQNRLFTIEPLLWAYQSFDDKLLFFNNYFRNLAGIKRLKKEIVAGLSEQDIRKSWQKDIEQYKLTRSKYLMYTDF